MLLALILGTALAAVAAPVAMGALEGDEEDDDVISDAEHDEARDGDGLLDPERVAHVIDGTSAETVIECFEAGKDRAVLQLDDWGTKLEVRNVYAAVQGGVYAWSPAGDFLFDIPLSTRPTNVTLGGPDGLSLFITGGKQLLRVRLSVPEPQAAAGFAAGMLIALPSRPRRR